MSISNVLLSYSLRSFERARKRFERVQRLATAEREKALNKISERDRQYKDLITTLTEQHGERIAALDVQVAKATQTRNKAERLANKFNEILGA